MSIFSNKTNIGIPLENKFEEIRTNKPYAEYDADGYQTGYFWYHGDTINLQFTIDGDVTDEENSTYQTADEFLSDKKVVVTLYNFRYQVIDEKVFDGNSVITYEIDSELSQKIIPGVYYCSLKIIQDTTTIYTLFGPDDCVFTVK